MAYKSKYYDPAKAHEYYLKHRQLKGRTKKTSISDLSEDGKIAAKEVKERLMAELKAALKGVKRGDKATRARLRAEYKEKYLKELEEIRKDSAMKKAPKEKKAKGAKSGAKGTKGTNSSPKGNSGEKGANNVKTAQKKTPTYAEIQKAIQKKVDAKLKEISERLPNMSEQEKADLKEQLTGLVKRLMAYR